MRWPWPLAKSNITPNKRFVRIRSYPVLAAHLIITVSAVFLFAELEFIRSFEFETPGPISGSSYASQAVTIDCLAVIPRIGQNTVKNAFSPLRLGPLRLLSPFGMYNDIAALSKSPFVGKIQAYPINIKNSIPLKLRI